MQENCSEYGPYLCRANLRGDEATEERTRRRAVLPIGLARRVVGEFELEVWIFWERVRILVSEGLMESGG